MKQRKPLQERTKTYFALGALCLGLCAIGLGVLRGEAAVVLQKAILICMECIGIG